MKVHAVALPALALAVLAGPALTQTEQQPSAGAAATAQQEQQGTSPQTEPALPGSRAGEAEFTPSDRIVISGTVRSSGKDALVIRTDDHRHDMRFDVAQANLPQDVKRGQRVRVTYHATGPIGQAADRVEPIDRTAGVQQQASLRMVTGSDADARAAERVAQRDNAEWRRRTGGTPAFAGGAQEGTTSATGTRRDTRAEDQDTKGTTTGTGDRDRTMPATASALPLLTLSGFFAFVSGLVLLRSRREEA